MILLQANDIGSLQHDLVAHRFAFRADEDGSYTGFEKSDCRAFFGQPGSGSCGRGKRAASSEDSAISCYGF